MAPNAMPKANTIENVMRLMSTMSSTLRLAHRRPTPSVPPTLRHPSILVPRTRFYSVNRHRNVNPPRERPDHSGLSRTLPCLRMISWRAEFSLAATRPISKFMAAQRGASSA